MNRLPHHSRVSFAITFLLIVAAGSVVRADSDAGRKPNVLFLFTDDQQADTIHSLGNSHVRTPNIDRLVAQGTAFTNTYIMGGSSPGVCLPSRASLLSGRTLWNIPNQGIWGYEISEKNKTLPEVFRESGYATFATGKNDPGKNGQFGRAYTHGDKLLFKGMSKQYGEPLYSFQADGKYGKVKPVSEAGKHSAEVYADSAIRFLESRAGNDQPFYAYVAFQTPHDPRQSPAEFRDAYKNEDMPLPASFMAKHPFDNGMLDIRDEKSPHFPARRKWSANTSPTTMPWSPTPTRRSDASSMSSRNPGKGTTPSSFSPPTTDSPSAGTDSWASRTFTSIPCGFP